MSTDSPSHNPRFSETWKGALTITVGLFLAAALVSMVGAMTTGGSVDETYRVISTVSKVTGLGLVGYWWWFLSRRSALRRSKSQGPSGSP